MATNIGVMWGEKSRRIVVLRQRLRETQLLLTERDNQIHDLELETQYQRGIIKQQGQVLNALQGQLSETSRNPEQIVTSILQGIAPLFIGYADSQDQETKQNRLNELITSMGGDPGDKGWVPEFEMDESWEDPAHLLKPMQTAFGNGKRPSVAGPTAPPPGSEVE